MLKPMFGNRPKNKKFEYQFRYYDPDKEKRKRRRIKIQRPHKKHHQGRSILIYAACLSFIVWLISVL